MAKLSLVTLFATLLALSSMTEQNGVIQTPGTMCLYDYNAHWENGISTDPENINTSICTYMVLIGDNLGVDSKTHEIKVLNPKLMIENHGFERFTKHKGKAKAIITLSGEQWSKQIVETISVDKYLEMLVASTIKLMSDYGFDGISIEWLDLGKENSPNFVKLLAKFSEKFANTKFILGLTLPAYINYDNLFIPFIKHYVDYFTIWTVNYPVKSNEVSHISPFPTQLDSLEEYHKRGIPRHKIFITIQMNARTWVLKNINNQDVGAESDGFGPQGPYSRIPGILNYNELCVMIQGNRDAFRIVQDKRNTAVYAVYIQSNKAVWISFEDRSTLQAKAQNITEQGYAGVAVHYLFCDDVYGVCGEKNPLLNAIDSSYFRGPITKPPTTTDGNLPFICHQEGFFRDKTHCNKYYECRKGDFGLELIENYCANNTQAFDEFIRKCVDHTKVPGC